MNSSEKSTNLQKEFTYFLKKHQIYDLYRYYLLHKSLWGNCAISDFFKVVDCYHYTLEEHLKGVELVDNDDLVAIDKCMLKWFYILIKSEYDKLLCWRAIAKICPRLTPTIISSDFMERIRREWIAFKHTDEIRHFSYFNKQCLNYFTGAFDYKF